MAAAGASSESMDDTFLIPDCFRDDVTKVLLLCPYDLGVEEVVERLEDGDDPLDIVIWWKQERERRNEEGEEIDPEEEAREKMKVEIDEAKEEKEKDEEEEGKKEM